MMSLPELGLIYLLLGSAAAFVRWFFSKRARDLRALADGMQRVLDRFAADVSISPLCCKSIVYCLHPNARCECFVCRRERGESVTDQTQVLAEQTQSEACQAYLASLNNYRRKPQEQIA